MSSVAAALLGRQQEQRRRRLVVEALLAESAAEQLHARGKAGSGADANGGAEESPPEAGPGHGGSGSGTCGSGPRLSPSQQAAMLALCHWHPTAALAARAQARRLQPLLTPSATPSSVSATPIGAVRRPLAKPLPWAPPPAATADSAAVALVASVRLPVLDASPLDADPHPSVMALREVARVLDLVRSTPSKLWPDPGMDASVRLKFEELLKYAEEDIDMGYSKAVRLLKKGTRAPTVSELLAMGEVYMLECEKDGQQLKFDAVNFYAKYTTLDPLEADGDVRQARAMELLRRTEAWLGGTEEEAGGGAVFLEWVREDLRPKWTTTLGAARNTGAAPAELLARYALLGVLLVLPELWCEYWTCESSDAAADGAEPCTCALCTQQWHAFGDQEDAALREDFVMATALEMDPVVCAAMAAVYFAVMEGPAQLAVPVAPMHLYDCLFRSQLIMTEVPGAVPEQEVDGRLGAGAPAGAQDARRDEAGPVGSGWAQRYLEAFVEDLKRHPAVPTSYMHLVDACIDAPDSSTKGNPDLRLLATMRRMLGLRLFLFQLERGGATQGSAVAPAAARAAAAAHQAAPAGPQTEPRAPVVSARRLRGAKKKGAEAEPEPAGEPVVLGAYLQAAVTELLTSVLEAARLPDLETPPSADAADANGKSPPPPALPPPPPPAPAQAAAAAEPAMAQLVLPSAELAVLAMVALQDDGHPPSLRQLMFQPFLPAAAQAAGSGGAGSALGPQARRLEGASGRGAGAGLAGPGVHHGAEAAGPGLELQCFRCPPACMFNRTIIDKEYDSEVIRRNIEVVRAGTSVSNEAKRIVSLLKRGLCFLWVKAEGVGGLMKLLQALAKARSEMHKAGRDFVVLSTAAMHYGDGSGLHEKAAITNSRNAGVEPAPSEVQPPAGLTMGSVANRMRTHICKVASQPLPGAPSDQEAASAEQELTWHRQAEDDAGRFLQRLLPASGLSAGGASSSWGGAPSPLTADGDGPTGGAEAGAGGEAVAVPLPSSSPTSALRLSYRDRIIVELAVQECVLGRPQEPVRPLMDRKRQLQQQRQLEQALKGGGKGQVPNGR
ncbi:hypothetical protein HYH03_007055 [Edaphochlamys debaryana]|uniref:Uncharacterized protein n=1 Tax=Edaphochlamys debaryana TaxID=47281 RepID=A0A835Y427_9CHLO|nr:hypothetical protein HYH03_007055 [Edaphochlamys debaryana]|eukprot:KAG2494812.1 hypothetical protein HYH03_007055 [Edaphochlamys debaryana]